MLCEHDDQAKQALDKQQEEVNKLKQELEAKETELKKLNEENALLQLKVDNVVSVLENKVKEGSKTLDWGSLRNFSPSPVNHAMFGMTEANIKLFTDIIKDLK